MAHEITATDNLVLAGATAWHGLGRVLPEACTPDQALAAALAWQVDQHPVWVYVDGKRQLVPGLMANYRSDLPLSEGYLGTVTEGYEVVQNRTLAEFCCSLADVGQEGGVRVETAGSIKGGRKVWFLLRATNITIGKAGDILVPYLLVSNSHDGSGSCRVTPTTVRVVCSNTMHMVVPQADTGALGSSAMVFRHTGSIHDRLEQCKQALQCFGEATVATKLAATKLAQVEATKETRQAYFFERYEADFGTVDQADTKAMAKVASAYESFNRRWDDEKAYHAGSLWGALNAYTGLVQHDLKARGKDDIARVERRQESNLFGLGARRTQAALDAAMELATAN